MKIAWILIIALQTTWTLASAQQGAEDQVTAAASVTPALIGADGLDFTQVAAAQQLGLSGSGVRVCIIDEGVEVANPNFGDCTAPGVPAPPACRIYFGYDVVAKNSNPNPRDDFAGHGTHVAGIAAGSFPSKLLDLAGAPLPYQRGVAYEALIGAVKADSVTEEGQTNFEDASLMAGVDQCIANNADIINMSLEFIYPKPYGALQQMVSRAAVRGVSLVAAAGNLPQGPKLFSVSSPAAYGSVWAVAYLNNTASPGAVVQLDQAISTATGMRDTLAAVQRADTSNSVCLPSCDNIPFPLPLTLLRSRKDILQDCWEPTVVGSQPDGRGLVVQITDSCKNIIYNDLFWNTLLYYRPPLVLLVLPSDEDTYTAILRYFNRQVPVLWLSASDGAALVTALTSRLNVSVAGVPAATVTPLPPEYAKQPAAASRMGPGFDLSIKPDIAAPGILYSSVLKDTYQVWPGTSMAAPYVAGVIALWMQQQRRLGVVKPSSGWPSAAFTALKNTAKPMPYPDSPSLMWPPAKVGAGVVQALHAALVQVSMTPNELLPRTDSPDQVLSVMLRNPSAVPVTYTLRHAPAVTMPIIKAWYGQPYDTAALVADINLYAGVVTVPARGSVKVPIGIKFSQALRQLDAIVSGYIIFTPTAPTVITWPAAPVNGTTAGGPLASDLPRSTLVTLSLPYQGSTRDYSTINGRNSLAVFASKLVPDPDPAASQLLDGQLSVCYQINQDDATECINDPVNPGTVRVSREYVRAGAIGFSAALVRPLEYVQIQVWSADGATYLGASVDKFGPCGVSSPRTVNILPYQLCPGPGGTDTKPWYGNYRTIDGTVKWLEVNKTYSFKLLLTPFLAAADRAAGKGPLGQVVTVPIRGKVRVVRRF